MRDVLKGSTDQSVVVRVVDSTDGTPETGFAYNTGGIDMWYRREGATKTSLTEADLAALDTAHADGGIKHIGDGYVRVDLPDAAVATGANGVMVGGTATGMVVVGCYVPLVGFDPYAEGVKGVADSGSTTTLVDSARTEADTDYFVGQLLVIMDGTLAGQARMITGFNAGTDTITVSPAFTQAISTHAYEIWPASAVSSLDAAAVRAAVGLASANLDTQLGDLPTNAELATSQAAADDATLAAVAALNDITAADVWAAGTRTLTSFGTLVADTAAAVWAAGTRTLTAISDSAGITTLLSRLSAALASKLASHAAAALVLVVDAGSTTTTVVFKTVEGTTPNATNDHYNGRVIVFLTGTLAGQATSISDYVGSTETATVVAMTGAPADNDTAMIV